jgi:hypothetical protein
MQQMTINELLVHILGDQPHALTEQLADWMAASSRFKAFVTSYRDKIRKKIRGARDAEGLRDLLLELATAYMLLEELRFTVEYEKYGLGKARGPDFVVTFKGRIPFNLEVTRLRAVNGSAEQRASGKQHAIGRFSDAVSGKLGQTLPGMINILLVAPDDDQIISADVLLAMIDLKARAERKDIQFFERKGFTSPSEFFKQFRQLSGILVRSSAPEQADKPAILWTNPQAKHPIPAALRAILQR